MKTGSCSLVRSLAESVLGVALPPGETRSAKRRLLAGEPVEVGASVIQKTEAARFRLSGPMDDLRYWLDLVDWPEDPEIVPTESPLVVAARRLVEASQGAHEVWEASTSSPRSGSSSATEPNRDRSDPDPIS